MRALTTLACCLTLCLLFTACASEEKLVKVNGKLKEGEQPFKMDPNGSISVSFVPIVAEGTHFSTYPATVERTDMSFVVPGRKGKGIPPGKYRVAIQLRTPEASEKINEQNQRLSKQHSPIMVEVNDETPLIIDVAKALQEK